MTLGGFIMPFDGLSSHPAMIPMGAFVPARTNVTLLVSVWFSAIGLPNMQRCSHQEFSKRISSLIMRNTLFALASAVILGSTSVYGCASNEPAAEAPADEATAEETTETAASPEEAPAGEGTLQVKANGEDFVRQGFVSKDGWQIDFQNLYVNLESVTAYQTDPPFDAEGDTAIQPVEEVVLVEKQTVDLAEGEADAEPILLAETTAPSGQYNAIAWEMATAEDGPAAGHVLMMVGTAEKDGQVIDFMIALDQEMSYTCGDFVGDERKGILEPDGMADLEATFHFDHIFGDGEAPDDDPINTGALGFDPLAAVAQDGQLDVDMAALESQLSAEDYALLQKTVAGLAHVGEGHCAMNEEA